MKKIQQGFTLIELMIVVAIIGILAAVAIPAYQDYIVKAKLSKVVSTLDPVKTALAMYFQEQGGFPIPASTTDYVGPGGNTPGAASTPNSIWTSLGFGNYPSLPNEVLSMALHSKGASGATSASNIAIVLVLQNVKAATVDGTLIAISPIMHTGGPVLPTDAVTTDLVAADSLAGASAINWYYGCAKGSGQATVDAVVKNFFKNGNTILKC